MTKQAHARVAPQRTQAVSEPQSNMTLMLIAAGFLCLTIALVVLQPLLTSSSTPSAPAPIAQTSESEPTPEPEPQDLVIVDADPIVAGPDPIIEPAEDTVTQAARAPLSTSLEPSVAQIDLSKVNANDIVRPQFALFSNTFTPLDRVTSATIKQQMRQPIRLIDTGTGKRDIPTLTSETLSHLSLGRDTVDPKLTDLVATAVFERQSDMYIRELVNTAANREPMTIPATLRTTKGDWDTYSLLKSMAKSVGGPISGPVGDVQTNGFQRIVPGASLARIALRYYGDPLKYDIILAANPQIDPINPVLKPGDTIQMPRP